MEGLPLDLRINLAHTLAFKNSISQLLGMKSSSDKTLVHVMQVSSILPDWKTEAHHDSSPQVGPTCQPAMSCNDQSLDSWQSAFQPYTGCGLQWVTMSSTKFPHSKSPLLLGR